MKVICRDRTAASEAGTHRGRQLQLRSLPVALLEELAGHQLCHLEPQKKTRRNQSAARPATSSNISLFTLRDMSQGLVTAPRSHAVIIMDLRGSAQIFVCVIFVIFTR